ncbi:WD40 repeat-like protein [Gyrodon lividus]|nr:WD40 repeat-like protein [Gyrodon lividus]
MLSSHECGGLKVWNGEISEWRPDQDEADPDQDEEDPTWRITFSSSGALVASGDSPERVALRDADSGEVVDHCTCNVLLSQQRKVGNEGGREYRQTRNLVPITSTHDDCTGVLWSWSGSQLPSASSDGTVRKWDLLYGEPIGGPFVRHADSTYPITISPDDVVLASVSGDKILRFWDVESGQPIGGPLKHDGDVFYAIFPPTGNCVATGCDDDNAYLWRPPGWNDEQQKASARQASRGSWILDFSAIQPAQSHRAHGYGRGVDILGLPESVRWHPKRANANAAGPGSHHPMLTLAGLRASWKSLWKPSRGDRPRLTTVYPGRAEVRDVVASDIPRPSQLPEQLETTPGHYELYSIPVPSHPHTPTDSLDDAPNENADEHSRVAFCGLCSKLFSRRPNPRLNNNPSTHESGVGMTAPHVRTENDPTSPTSTS